MVGGEPCLSGELITRCLLSQTHTMRRQSLSPKIVLCGPELGAVVFVASSDCQEMDNQANPEISNMCSVLPVLNFQEPPGLSMSFTAVSGLLRDLVSILAFPSAATFLPFKQNGSCHPTRRSVSGKPRGRVSQLQRRSFMT